MEYNVLIKLTSCSLPQPINKKIPTKLEKNHTVKITKTMKTMEKCKPKYVFFKKKKKSLNKTSSKQEPFCCTR